MSTEKEQDGKHQKKQNNTPPELPAQSEGDKKKSARERDYSANYSHRYGKVVKKIVLFVWQKDNQAQLQNIIAAIAVCVAIWLAVVTYQVYKLALGQANSVINTATAAKISADASTKSANLQKQALDSQISAKRQSDIADSKKLKRDTDFINKQEKGINAQINAIKTNQSEFEIENRPFIEIGNITIDTPAVGKIMTSSASIGNGGKQPAFIISAAYGFVSSFDSNYTSMENIPAQPDIINDYLPNNETIPIQSSADIPISQMAFDYVNGKKLYVYFRGKIKYRGLVKNKIYKFKFIYRITVDKKRAAKTVFYKSD